MWNLDYIRQLNSDQEGEREPLTWSEKHNLYIDIARRARWLLLGKVFLSTSERQHAERILAKRLFTEALVSQSN